MSNERPPDDRAALIPQYAQLLSLAAHEFRTPASVVGGYLRMLQRDTESPLTKRQRKMIDEAAKSRARLVSLIGELSEVGKLASNNAAVKKETFDLFKLVEEVAGNVQEGEDREVRLKLSGADTGARLTGDGTRMRTALHAIFHAILREQPVAVTVRVDRRLEQADGTTSAVLVIAPDADVHRAYGATASVFDEKRGGVGLSLPIARRVIERLGGRIWSPTPAGPEDRDLKTAVVVSVPLPK